MREFKTASTLFDGNLTLSIAPALTPNGIENDPLFFNGEIINPTIVSGGLLVLADIVSTRYFKYVPVDLRDPILCAQGDRLRAECFSACNGVYARMDVFQSALDGDILYGTTNVDIGNNLRKSLLNIRQGDRLKLRIGDEGLKTLHSKNLDNGSVLTDIVTQRPVKMPDRWIRALGNCAMLHQNMEYKFHIEGMQAKSFIAMLPPATGKERSGWLTPTKTGVMLKSREEKNSVYISGLHRLSALKRIMSNVNAVYFYAPNDGEPGQMMIEVCMTGANITLSLTAKSYEGYSGEGALLDSLSTPKILECADKIDNILNFESRLDIDKISKSIGIVKNDMNDAMELLAVSGKLGFDVRDRAFFHRELPDDPDRVLKDNPRLVGAKKLVEDTEYIDDNIWYVKSGDTTYRVIFPTDENLENAKCTCTWYLKHQNSRGPCKHILAVKLKKGV
ncbi:SWIM zinc finger family protein [Lachnoanaerobaculum umeaense]|uniref:SWIM zinc finger family protein n=1 Tax=Lachnoanaerobaculum umeaense TaxID=617123 RepID=A0A385PZ42_9FIRM|nr:SWIM zinc finger family protein [Lachnoanaerobaculum umeaense]AYA98839.1 SWIM zinc finger family protein [Lachnoanaerobaculum umeaense]PZW94887.1 SWIM zinc finger protein [Lachnoanaerobaculum umeaense]